jgi:Holliday junction DNA helicase RuvA
VALRILSGMNINELYNAIVAEDVTFFTGIPGVGRKTGERLIVELKQRVEKLPLSAEKEPVDNREIFSGAVEALTVLGYKRKDAVSAVSRIMKTSPRTSIIEDIISDALKKV